MKNIIKSIWYEILRSKLMIKIYVAFIGVMVLIGILNVDQSCTASKMIADAPTVTVDFPLFMLAFIVAIICGEDYMDKVANYEILFGHSRKSIFFARSLMAVITASILALILCFIPIIAGCIKGGWGSTLELKDVVLRQLLFVFPFLRLAAFLVVLTFLIKNPYIMMAIGFVIAMSMEMISSMLDHSKSLYLSLFNIGLLTRYDGWSIYNVDPNLGIVNYHSYISALSPGVVIGTIAVSLAMTAFYLFMGYALFRRDELN